MSEAFMGQFHNKSTTTKLVINPLDIPPNIE